MPRHHAPRSPPARRVAFRRRSASCSGSSLPIFSSCVAERLADAHRLAAELDREAADRVVAVALRAGQAGRRGDAVAHAVLRRASTSARPTGWSWPSRCRSPEHLDAAPRTRCVIAAVRLADAEHGVLVAAFAHGAADARRPRTDRPRCIEATTPSVLAPADDAGDRLLVDAVLQRDDEAVAARDTA